MKRNRQEQTTTAGRRAPRPAPQPQPDPAAPPYHYEYHPLYPDYAESSAGMQYFGGGRQNYAGVEHGAGPLGRDVMRLDQPLPYAWERPSWERPHQGSYRGLGPKGYQRSDERIEEDVCDRLCDDHFVDASDISVSVESGVVTLEGSVADRGQKHRAEDIADACLHVTDVHNHLRVSKPRGNGSAVPEAGGKTKQ